MKNVAHLGEPVDGSMGVHNADRPPQLLSLLEHGRKNPIVRPHETLRADLRRNRPASRADPRINNSHMARIIHQPQKSTRESAFEVRIALRVTASPDHPDPKTSPSGCPGSAQIGRPVAIGHTASSQPAWAYNEHLALEPSTLSMELTGFARSDARRPTRSNCASKPAPPGTTRATIS